MGTDYYLKQFPAGFRAPIVGLFPMIESDWKPTPSQRAALMRLFTDRKFGKLLIVPNSQGIWRELNEAAKDIGFG